MSGKGARVWMLVCTGGWYAVCVSGYRVLPAHASPAPLQLSRCESGGFTQSHLPHHRSPAADPTHRLLTVVITSFLDIADQNLNEVIAPG